MSLHRDPVLSARLRALPVYLSPEGGAESDVFRRSGMPTAFVLEPRATTMFLSAFFDAGVQSSAPWLSVASMFGASPSANSTLSGRFSIIYTTQPALNAALMRFVCPSRALRTKVLLAIFECALRRIDEV